MGDIHPPRWAARVLTIVRGIHSGHKPVSRCSNAFVGWFRTKRENGLVDGSTDVTWIYDRYRELVVEGLSQSESLTARGFSSIVCGAAQWRYGGDG